MNKKISIIICTYNGKDLIEKCLDSVLMQTYPNFEVLCVDGMSKDNSQEIIKDYCKKDKRIKLLINKNRLPEGKGNGKWFAFKKCKGDIIGIIDQDNVLQRNDLFKKVISNFNTEKDILGILGGLKNDRKDNIIERYIALFGTDSFFAYRSIDFIHNIKNLDFSKDFEQIKLQKNNMYITGGNCFFYKKRDIEKLGGYDQDVFLIKRLINDGKNKLIIIKNSTKHYAEKNLYSLIIKKIFWSKKFKISQIDKFNYFPSTKLEFREFSKNLLSNIFILPNFYDSFIIYHKFKDPVAFLFPIISFLNTLAYAITFF